MGERLAGRTALVTGSTSGIGRAIAEAYAAEGAFVVVSGRRTERGEAVVKGITAAGGRGAFVPGDLSGGRASVAALAREAVEAAGGRLDVLVNNAALLLRPAPTAQVDEETIDAALATSVRAVFLLTGLLAPPMAERGRGAVVNVGSINGTVGMARSALYSMTKAAVHSLTKSWAAEFGPSGVRVNTLAPGPTATEGNEALGDLLAPFYARMPSGRPGTLAEVAAAAVFLASDESTGVHGATLAVDGGFTAV